ncbi:50S ribosomal protein L11 methyltransferase [Fodinibius sediminis]|uniref:Ribosomal protein L11 methyltransferase n=1 Tax=Fodinibius sediminis TaxID=1214077 RepID=A0A521DA58_9BACT|nr:50S ribosomal protein L11 methyltransferase [Fodinibius sediminis]SMO68548.1 [LSU ribosomal protein L11P]-lysine N-methyltransferase [Fodinibius sediminis]
MKYIKLVIAIDDEYQEPFIAELFDMGFDGFEQRDNSIIAYITEEGLGVGDRERIEQLLAGFPGNGFIETEELVSDKNWNEEWEQTIKAQEIGQFFVKPTWSDDPVPEGKILLEIDPKMSFGTGYHETTRLMLNFLPSLVKKNDILIDAGTGTGILAIAAVKLGARHALAFDIDEWSIGNARENILLNGVKSRITLRKGSAEVIQAEEKADLLMANIQRNVILELLPAFTEALGEKGNLLLSGLQEDDEDVVRNKLKAHFEIISLQQENEWIAVHAKRKK